MRTSRFIPVGYDRRVPLVLPSRHGLFDLDSSPFPPCYHIMTANIIRIREVNERVEEVAKGVGRLGWNEQTRIGTVGSTGRPDWQSDLSGLYREKGEKRRWCTVERLSARDHLVTRKIEGREEPLGSDGTTRHGRGKKWRAEDPGVAMETRFYTVSVTC
ncbi:hypothetical protein CRG98_015128 [Punica granatum]|uniref:Uncharacterized protein n=1 Tax=Punica granatum TaxID=22663 RepID=A0A2I0K8G2_PUNGR|nr:hypothetical protein CRG98_015128 [Punica granatum]